MLDFEQWDSKWDYNVDIVICIDLTNSMRDYIEEVKDKTLGFHEQYLEAMEQADISVARLRVKVIGFRDFGFGSEPIVDSSKFFELPDESEEFERFVRALQVDTGGDIPESGLEAIALAMKSDWLNVKKRQRHIMLMFTDAPAHPLGFGSDSVHYPEGMPADLAELARWWVEGVPNGSYNPRSGRLVVFAPEVYPWNEMSKWYSSLLVPPKAGAFIDERDFEYAVDMLVRGFF